MPQKDVLPNSPSVQPLARIELPLLLVELADA
jgi:hypothetical protein